MEINRLSNRAIVANPWFAVSQTLKEFKKGLGFQEILKNAEEASLENTKENSEPKQPTISASTVEELQIFSYSVYDQLKNNKVFVSNHGGQRHEDHIKHCKIHGTSKNLGHTKDDNHGAGGKKAGTTDNCYIGYITKHKDEKDVTFSALRQTNETGTNFRIIEYCNFILEEGSEKKQFQKLNYDDFKELCPKTYDLVKDFEDHFTITILGGPEDDSDCLNGNQIKVVGLKGEEQDVETYIANHFLRCEVNPFVYTTSKQPSGKMVTGFLDRAKQVAEKHPEKVIEESVSFDDPYYGKGTLHCVLNPKSKTRRENGQTYQIQQTTGIRGTFCSGLSQKNMICSKVDVAYWAKTLAPMLGIMINKSDFLFYIELEDESIYHNMDRTSLIQDVKGEQSELKFADLIHVISKHLPQSFRDKIANSYKMESSDSFNDILEKLEKKIDQPEKAEYKKPTQQGKRKSTGNIKFRPVQPYIRKSRGGLFNKENPMVDISKTRDSEFIELNLRYILDYDQKSGIIYYDSSGSSWQYIQDEIFRLVELEIDDLDSSSNEVYVKKVFEYIATMITNCHNVCVGKKLTWNGEDNRQAWSKESLTAQMFSLIDNNNFLKELKKAIKKDQENRVNS